MLKPTKTNWRIKKYLTYSANHVYCRRPWPWSPVKLTVREPTHDSKQETDYSYFTFKIPNNKGADQTARMRRLVCALVVRKLKRQFFSRMEAHMMLKPRLPGLRLATRLELLSSPLLTFTKTYTHTKYIRRQWSVIDTIKHHTCPGTNIGN